MSSSEDNLEFLIHPDELKFIMSDLRGEELSLEELAHVLLDGGLELEYLSERYKTNRGSKNLLMVIACQDNLEVDWDDLARRVKAVEDTFPEEPYPPTIIPGEPEDDEDTEDVKSEVLRKWSVDHLVTDCYPGLEFPTTVRVSHWQWCQEEVMTVGPKLTAFRIPISNGDGTAHFRYSGITPSAWAEVVKSEGDNLDGSRLPMLNKHGGPAEPIGSFPLDRPDRKRSPPAKAPEGEGG